MKRVVVMFPPQKSKDPTKFEFPEGDNFGFHPGSGLPTECFGLGCEHDLFCSSN